METNVTKMEIIKSAIISDCGLYRYQLSRIWNPEGKKVMFLMLNPSKADANKDDPTIRRCISFAKSWGYGGLYVGNLYAYRCTDPKLLLQVYDPEGPLNWAYLHEMASLSEMVVLAWGNAGIVTKLGKKFTGKYIPLKVISEKLYVLKVGKSGHPWHPLFLKSELKPIALF